MTSLFSTAVHVEVHLPDGTTANRRFAIDANESGKTCSDVTESLCMEFGPGVLYPADDEQTVLTGNLRLPSDVKYKFKCSAAGAADRGRRPPVYRFTPNKREGLQGRGYRASRATTLLKLLGLIATLGLVVIKGSPMTGKTSLMQQLADLALGQGWASVLYISAAAGSAAPTVIDLVTSALRQQGDGRTWSDLWSSPSPRQSAVGEQQQGGSYSDAGQAQDYQASELTLLLIDEAQLVFANSRKDTEFWMNMKSLQQGFASPRTRRTVRVAMFALYGDAPSGAPCTGPSVSPIPFTNMVSFKADDNSHGVQLALNSEESEELWKSFIQQNNLGPMFQDKKLRQALLELTVGHVGLLVTFLDKLDKKLQSVSRDLVGHGDDQIRRMFTKGEIYQSMMQEVRGVLHDLADLDKAEPIMEALVNAGSEGCSHQELRDAWMKADPEVKRTRSEATDYVNHLYYQGFIVQDPTTNTFHLVSPLHRSFYLTQLKTLCYDKMPLDSAADFDAFLRHSIRRISGSALKTSLSKRCTEDRRIYERHYQVEWYKAARSCLAPASIVSPDVGRVYSCNGAVDFWVQNSPNAKEGCAVELLVHGDRAEGHEARFESDGKYAMLPCAHRALLDFWTKPYIIRHQRSPHYYIIQLATDFKTANIVAANDTVWKVELMP